MQKLPTAVKKARGTNRPDRRPNEPQLDVEEPPMPSDLTSKEQARWKLRVEDLKAMGVLTRADGVALKQLVICEVEVDEVHAIVSLGRTTSVMSTQKEQVERVHVLYPTLLSLRRELRALWTCFGMDPLARTSVHTVPLVPAGGARGAAPTPEDDETEDGNGSKPAKNAKPQGGVGRYFN